MRTAKGKLRPAPNDSPRTATKGKNRTDEGREGFSGMAFLMLNGVRRAAKGHVGRGRKAGRHSNQSREKEGLIRNPRHLLKKDKGRIQG